jgi:hypothetical protein
VLKVWLYSYSYTFLFQKLLHTEDKDHKSRCLLHLLIGSLAHDLSLEDGYSSPARFTNQENQQSLGLGELPPVQW